MLTVPRRGVLIGGRWTTPSARFRRLSTPRAGIAEIGSDLREKRRSATEICEAWLRNARAAENVVHSFLYLDDYAVLEQARELDRAVASGDGEGSLAGVPIAIKDNVCTQAMPTTAASKVLEHYTPTYDATVVEKLRAAGAILIGKTNMDEFGMGNSTENSAFKITKNPWDVGRVPGGSSGGSAAAVAAGQTPVALGSDTGGSIRQPAHFCGCVGIKPSYGRVSRYGLISYGSSLDAIGPMAQTVKDAAAVLQVIAGAVASLLCEVLTSDPAGHDVRDATTVDVPVPDYTSGLKSAEKMEDLPLKGKRIGVILETTGEGVDDVILSTLNKTASHLQQCGADVQEVRPSLMQWSWSCGQVSIKDFDIGLPSYYVIALSEASSNLSRYDGVRYGLQRPAEDIEQLYSDSRMYGLGAEVKRRILMGTYALSAGYYDAYYKRAQQVRTLLTREFNAALDSFDALLSPASPSMPWRIGEFVEDPLTSYKADLMSVGCNLAGLPGIVVPAGMAVVDGVSLPIGLQLLGRSFCEASLIRTAHVVEQTLGLKLPVPPSLLGT